MATEEKLYSIVVTRFSKIPDEEFQQMEKKNREFMIENMRDRGYRHDAPIDPYIPTGYIKETHMVVTLTPDEYARVKIAIIKES